MKESAQNRWLFWLLFSAAVSWIFFTAPGLTSLDAGELGAASVEFGIAHAPGFALFASTHHLFLGLPFLEMAERLNLASGAFGLLALTLGFATLLRLKVRASAAATGLFLSALCPLFLLHQGTIEVYSGLCAFACALAYCAISLQQGDLRYAFALAFLSGLTLGHHAELRLFAVATWPLCIWSLRKKPKIWPLFIAIGLAGGLCAAYLPIRAAMEPWRNWGDPSTPQAFFDHLMGARIRSAYADQFGAFDFAAIRELLSQLWSNANVLVLLGIPGIFLPKKEKGWGFIVAFLVLDLFYSSVLNPMGLRDRQNALPTVLFWGFLSAYTFEKLASLKTSLFAIASGLSVLSAGILVFPYHQAFSDDRILPEVISEISDQAPPESIVFVSSDSLAAGLAFAQVVEGFRPDIAVVVRQHIWDPSSINPVKNRLPNAFQGYRGTLESLDVLSENSQWPLLWEWSNDSDQNARPNLKRGWPLSQRNITLQNHLSFKAERLKKFAPPNSQGATTLANLLDDQGRHAKFLGDNQTALWAFQEAATVEPTATRFTNFGVALADSGRLQEAYQATQWAISLDSQNNVAKHNLARFALNLAHPNALPLVLELLEENPNDAQALAFRGLLFGQRGDFAQAKADFESALKIDPTQAEAQAGLMHLKKLEGLGN